MNRAQHLTLKIVLAIDALLILFPPFGVRNGYGRVFNRGYQWLLYGVVEEPGAYIDFGTLAAEILIVSLVGFTVFVFVRDVADDRFARLLTRARTLVGGARLAGKKVARWIGGAIGIGLVALGVALAGTAQNASSIVVGVCLTIIGTAICAVIHIARHPY